MDTFFAQNLRLLRKRLKEKISIMKLGEQLDINKETLGSYERGRAEPKYTELIKLANYFDVNIGDLLTKDMSLGAIETLFPKQINLRILASTVNTENENNIEFVPLKAIAGYVEGYGDIEYIEKLPAFQIPFLKNDKKYRVFPIQGDSMLPLKEGSYVFAEYIEDWWNIKNGTICIVVTKQEGIVLKKVFNYLTEKDVLVLKSTNERYAPYPVLGDEIKELWKFVSYYSSEFPSE